MHRYSFDKAGSRVSIKTPFNQYKGSHYKDKSYLYTGNPIETGPWFLGYHGRTSIPNKLLHLITSLIFFSVKMIYFLHNGQLSLLASSLRSTEREIYFYQETNPTPDLSNWKCAHLMKTTRTTTQPFYMLKRLTHWVTYICVFTLGHLFGSKPLPRLNPKEQTFMISKSTYDDLRSGNAFENIIFEMAVILSLSQWLT